MTHIFVYFSLLYVAYTNGRISLKIVIKSFVFSISLNPMKSYNQFANSHNVLLCLISSVIAESFEMICGAIISEMCVTSPSVNFR